MSGFPPCPERPRALTPADLGLPTHVLDRRGELCAAAWQVPTDLGRVARGPGACPQRPTGRGLPGLREASRASARATGRCRRRQAQILHEWSGVLDAGQVAECRDGRDRPRHLPATAGLHRLNDRAEPPSGDRLMACRCQALEPGSVVGDRPDICWEDDGLGGGGTDDRAQPAPVRRTPRGSAGIPEIRPSSTRR